MTKTVTVDSNSEWFRPWRVKVNGDVACTFTNQADAEQWADVLRERHWPKWEIVGQGIRRFGHTEPAIEVYDYEPENDDLTTEQAAEVREHLVEWLTAKGWT